MERFAVLLTHVDVKKIDRYDRDLTKAQKKAIENFDEVAKYPNPPAYVWPVSLKNPNPDDSEDMDEEEKTLIDKKFKIIK